MSVSAPVIFVPITIAVSSLPEAVAVTVSVGRSDTALTVIARVCVSESGSATALVVPSSFTVKVKLPVPLASGVALNCIPLICASV